MKRALSLALIALAATISLSSAADAATLDQAAASVQRMADSKPGPTRGYQLGWALMDYVHANVSPTRYANLAKKPVTVDEILATRAGICGSQITAALAIADRIGLKARPVEMYGSSHGKRWSHIAIEVWANGGWRFFDVTWNTVYRKHPGARTLMSITGLRRLSVEQRLEHKDTIGDDPWRDEYTRRYGDVFTYVTADEDIVIGGNGTYRLPRLGDHFRVGVDVPNYIGSLRTYGERHSNLRMRLDGLTVQSVTLKVQVLGAGGHVIARSETTASQAITPETRTVTLPVRGSSVVLSVSGGAALVVSRVAG